MNSSAILWVDDEIDLLRPHIFFLREKGYDVQTCNNGYDALELVAANNYALIILDEMMPGMTGLETLPRIKEIRPMTPVVMVTKSEEENIMDKAVGKKIADYLIKPVNPSQVLLSIKKNLHQRQLITEQTTADYRSQFADISSSLIGAKTFADWVAIYKRLVNWEIELAQTADPGIADVLRYQRQEAGSQFARFVRDNYLDWINRRGDDTPVMSHTLMRARVLPVVDANAKTTLLLIDNFRYDQWKAIGAMLNEDFTVVSEEFYCSILPTATQYARNAIFAGLMPLAIDKLMPDRWLNDNEEGGKNLYEEDFLHRQLQSHHRNLRVSFDKLVRPEAGRKLIDNIQHVYQADLSVIVYNFLDILSHARTETDIIRDLTEDEAAFRSLTHSWFEHSELFVILKMLAAKGHTVIITTDHGTVRVDNPVKIVGDRETSPNLRYKTGRNLNYNHKELFVISKPEEAQLPRSNITSSYVFASNSDFFVYPTNTNQFARYYKGTFQHGGISMEEMIIPFIVLQPR